MNKVEVTVGIPTRNRERWLRESIASVLAQSMPDFRLIISDNASNDATRETVEALDDHRIDYRRSEVDIGMTNNFNRVIELTDSEFLIMLPDDDLLYPDYLLSAVEVLRSNPTVGVVHTAFDLVDGDSRLIDAGRMLLKTHAPIETERGDALIERSMKAGGIVCWSSALFRMEALTAAHGLRMDDEPFADGPLMMRIGLNWDFSCISRPLAAVRIHSSAESAAFGSFNGERYAPDDAVSEYLYKQRLHFLDEAHLPPDRDSRYRAFATRTFRGDMIGHLSLEVGVRRDRRATLGRLLGLARSDFGILFVPAILKLAIALVVGRDPNRLAIWPRRR